MRRNKLEAATATDLSNTIQGTTKPPFERIEKIFRQNFEQGYERAGAAFAVFRGAELVVDLYGGYAEPQQQLPWKYDTMSIFFSTTKSLTSIVLAAVINQNRAQYDDLVRKYWPEFAQNGKESVTIKHVVHHQAGIPYGDVVLSIDDVMTPERMTKVLEKMKPLWIPGTKCGYHALTFGFLVDQIVRRLDPRKRGVEQILREDILEKYGVKDISIGLPDEQSNLRVATVVQQTSEGLEVERKLSPEGVRLSSLSDNEHHKRLYETWPWIRISEYNNPKKRCLKMPSNMGIGTARGLAELHSILARGKLLPSDMLELISTPQIINEMDIINGYPENKGFGWQYSKNKLGNWNFGHSGHGGQIVRVDLETGLSYAYLCNGLKSSDSDHVLPFRRLQEALYDCVLEIQAIF